jgi:hypothetical protein
MLRKRLVFLCAGFVFVGAMTGATKLRESAAPVVTREIVAVYLGTEGTDLNSGMATAVRDMQTALARQARASARVFVSHGVSLEPSVAGGLRHLAALGSFDEVSVGGNWANSAVVQYLGRGLGDSLKRLIPQVVLVEREVRVENGSIEIGVERELARYAGTSVIAAWASRGAPIPR